MTDYLLTGLLFDLLFWSLLLWQIGIITYILLNKFYDKNPRTISNNQPRRMAVEVDLPKNKSIEHVDVDMKKNILMEKAKVSNLKTDEVIKGKVNTQKNKLKKLRGL